MPTAQPAPESRRAVARWRRLLPLVGLLLLGWVLSRLSFADMGRALGQVPLLVVWLSSGSFVLNLLLKALRWQRLLRAQGVRIPLRVAIAAFMSGQFYGQVTLGRAGEFLRVEALTERGMGAGSALASCVFDRLLDLFAVIVCGGVLSALVLGRTDVALAALSLLVSSALAVAALLRLLAREDGAHDDWLSRALAALSRRRPLARVIRGVQDLARGMRPMLKPLPLLEAGAFTAVAWLLYFAALWQLAEGLSLGVSRTLLTATASFAALSALLPITVSGLGARELIYVQVLAAHGVAGERAVVMSLLHLFVMSASATVVGFGGVLARQRQRL